MSLESLRSLPRRIAGKSRWCPCSLDFFACDLAAGPSHGPAHGDPQHATTDHGLRLCPVHPSSLALPTSVYEGWWTMGIRRINSTKNPIQLVNKPPELQIPEIAQFQGPQTKKIHGWTWMDDISMIKYQFFVSNPDVSFVTRPVNEQWIR